MAESSEISWVDSTFNCWIGCQKVSLGCDNCYAESRWDHGLHFVEWGPHGARRRTSVDYWRGPIRWNAKADRFEQEHGHRQRVFCASLADVFDNQVDPQWRIDLFELIKKTPRLDWLLLTKRPQNIRKMLPPDWGHGWPNVWLGTTTESQEYYDQRWPILSRIPAVIHFVSYEPAVGPLRTLGHGPPDWLICGGESGPQRRPMDPAWAREVFDQCRGAGVAFFMKQDSGLKPGKQGRLPDDLWIKEWPVSKGIN